jgi:hypothetical protein
MPQAKFSKLFDYYKPGQRMTSYPKGYEGDVPQAHYDAAVEAGAIDGAAPAKADDKAAATGDGKAAK